MLHQDEQDGLFPDTEPYPEYNQPFRSEVSYLKDMMGYLLGQLKVDNNFTVVDFDTQAKKIAALAALNTGPATGNQADPMIAYMAKTNAYLMRRIRELETGNSQL